MATLKVDGVGFNTEAFQTISKADFVAHPAHQTFWPDLSPEARKDRLERTWHHITGIPEGHDLPDKTFDHVTDRNEKTAGAPRSPGSDGAGD